MTAAAIALTAHKIEESQAIEGAINLGVTNTIAGFLVLLGIGLLYGRTGLLNLAEIGAVLAQRPVDSLVIVAFLLIVCGYFIKGSVAPFHFWLDDAHAVAPTPVCVLFSGVMVQLALYGVARIYWTVFEAPLASHEMQIRALFIGVGIATALIGAVMAYSQRHLKRLLAFSTVSHSGIFVAAMGLFDRSGIAAVALYIAAHGLIKGMLFICSGTFLNRFRTLDEGELRGRWKDVPVTAVLYLLGGLALAGLPAFGISAAKIFYDDAFKTNGFLAVVVVMSIASAIDGSAVVRNGLHLIFGIGDAVPSGISPREEETEVDEPYLKHTPFLMIAPAVLLLCVAVWISFDTNLWHGIERASSLFVDRGAYAASVLQGLHRTQLPLLPERRTAESIGVNLGVTALAILLAFAALLHQRIPSMLRNGMGVFSGFFLKLRLLHSGMYTDYVTYIMFGVAAYGVWLVASVR
jgi:multicomponent Na+:H+ antiporter subunit D